MKKVLILLMFVFLLTGCTTNTSVKDRDIDEIIDTMLKTDTSLVNNASNGYKYYLPNGVKVIESNNYNEKLYYNGNYYYLYVDVVSYYYKTEVSYEEDDSLYFSKKISYNNKDGYLEIEKIDNVYRVRYVYNYSKIESYVDDENLKQTIINMSYILNSIKFNDSITELVVSDKKDSLKEEVYDFYTPRNKDNFIDYINQYDEYEEETIDDNNIGKEESE